MYEEEKSKKKIPEIVILAYGIFTLSYMYIALWIASIITLYEFDINFYNKDSFGMKLSGSKHILSAENYTILNTIKEKLSYDGYASIIIPILIVIVIYILLKTFTKMGEWGNNIIISIIIGGVILGAQSCFLIIPSQIQYVGFINKNFENKTVLSCVLKPNCKTTMENMLVKSKNETPMMSLDPLTNKNMIESLLIFNYKKRKNTDLNESDMAKFKIK